MWRFALVAGIAGTPLAQAADLHVGPGQPYLTIADAVAVAQTGDRVLLEPGTYVETIDIGATHLTFVAEPGTVTWSGSTGVSILTSTGGELVVSGIDFAGALTHRAIAVTGGPGLLVEDCAFDDHQATDVGGAILLDNASSTILRSSFTGNGVTAAVRGLGGAIRMTGGTHVIEDSFFFGNGQVGPDGWGGAIYANDPAVSLTIRRSTFSGNQAVYSGGAVEIASGDLLVEDTLFQTNSAVAGAALVCDQTATCAVTDSAFRTNTATAEGGAMLLYYTQPAELTRSLFCSNSGGSTGGSLYAWGSTASVQNNVFAENSANIGGAVASSEPGTVVSENNSYVDNVATTDGGAIRILYGGVLDSNNDLIAWNEAASGLAGNAVTTVYGTTFTYGFFHGNLLGNTNGTFGTGTTAGSDPLLAGWPGGLCQWSEFVPQLGSTLIDTGDIALSDPDGTRSDIGAFGGPSAPVDRVIDADGDGFVAFDDCDDDDPLIHPNAQEVCDGGVVDEDCDGLVDNEDPSTTGLVPTWPDLDGDTYGDNSVAPTDACLSEDRVDNDLDCDDTDALFWAAPTWYGDTDSDGLGNPADTAIACTAPPGYVANADDCDDTDGAIGAPTAWYLDGDGDGHGLTATEVFDCIAPADHVALDGDCDDAEPLANPSLPEVCDGIDNDCDLYADDADPDVDLTTAGDWYLDSDGDGHGVGAAVTVCTPPPGYASLDGDCNDADDTVFPGAPESCNGVDDDCDGPIDENAINETTWYFDSDGDGYGEDATVQTSCDPLPDAVFLGGDCDDNNSSVYPDADELCDLLDNDCDGATDEEAIDGLSWILDSDGDGYGTEEPDADVTIACSQPAGFAATADDCNDGDANTWPGAPEICDSADNDCDGVLDEDLPLSSWWVDSDGDGYGDPGPGTEEACGPVDGRVDNDLDCDDSDPAVNPDATDAPANGVDEDCDGEDLPGDSTREPTVPDPDGTGPKDAVGCGCATGAPGAPAGLLWLVGALALARRRR